jgi:hypothetical protein
MTTINTEATASTEQSEETLATAEDQVAQAVQAVETEGEPAPEITPAPEQPSYATAAQLRSEIGGLQGRIAQRSGEESKALGDRLERLEGMLTQVADHSYNEQLRNMDPDEREQFLLSENQRLRTPQEPTAPAPVQVARNQWGMTPADQVTLTNRVQGMIEGMGIEGISPHSPEIWTGAGSVQTADQLIGLVRQNLNTRRPAAQAPTPPAAAPKTITNSAPVVQTTQGAPSTPAGSYDTLQDISTALSNGEVTTQDFREWMRGRGLGQN